MPISDADKRDLVYPLWNPLTIDGDTPDDGTPILPFAWSSADSDEKVQITLELSLNEYVAIASSVDVGRDIAYGTDTNKIWWIWTRALIEGGAMTCDDVANCIETDAGVLAALLAQLSTNGYAPTGNSENSPTNVTMSPARSAENLLPTGYDCSDAQLMATARAVVQKFDEFTQDFFDQLELLTNPLELVAITSDGIPVADTLGNVADFADFVAQTVRETYQASYNNAAETEIACALYCAMVVDCELTHDMLVSVLDELQVVEYPSPSDMNDFQAIADWMMGLDLQVGVATVAAFHLLIALAMKFGSGTIFEMAGLVGLRTIIAGTVGLLDTSYTECDCAPEETPDTYWYMEWDFALSGFGMTIANAPNTVYKNGGYESVGGSTTVAGMGLSMGSTALWLAGVSVEALRRGSIGNGTFDYHRLTTYPNENWGGTAANSFNSNFISENTNDVVRSRVDYLDNTISFKSFVVYSGVDGAFVANTNFTRITKVRLWGFNHANYKPPGAIWVADRV